MARLGFIFHGICLVGILLLALSCASGDDEGTTGGTGGTAKVTGGTGGGTGGTSGVTGGTGGTKPVTGGIGGTSGQGDPPAGGVGGAGGTAEEPPICGNNSKEGTEICDGTDLGGATCDTLVTGQVGELSCAADCTNYVTDMCHDPIVTDAQTPDTYVGM
ncbi:MAG: hypothetical protein JXA30_16915 [Deltaproteobacteria bacterium]|nr:hypothetical protein [Deltaproteobacteria bacterium]